MLINYEVNYLTLEIACDIGIQEGYKCHLKSDEKMFHAVIEAYERIIDINIWIE